MSRCWDCGSTADEGLKAGDLCFGCQRRQDAEARDNRASDAVEERRAARARNREVIERWACQEAGHYEAKTLAWLVSDTSVGAVANRFNRDWPWAGLTKGEAVRAVLDAVIAAHRVLGWRPPLGAP